MGTGYEIAQGPGHVQLRVDESSNTFDIVLSKDEQDIELGRLSTAQLIEVATHLLRIASYWGAESGDIAEAGRLALDYRKQFPVVTIL